MVQPRALCQSIIYSCDPTKHGNLKLGFLKQKFPLDYYYIRFVIKYFFSPPNCKRYGPHPNIE